ncbi:MAG: O-antigen ligase family protein [Symploca sp. SIO3C6]|uniref:O-antigen ligase family protein n=1 Tax=Symploca sp. SIO1C4 TaxID=2607765 RepID=A0A6B3N4Q4_9CYAN|nr:O-antigen ligase family protein [Symploca sp. SIO3C6]NER26503.1 O-antigen ligase family protein [Symploca sp. SIO1C4]
MIFRTGASWGWGIHSITQPMIYPVTLIDYLFFFAFFFLISLRPYKASELKIIAWSFVLTALPVFIVALGEKYWDWQGKSFFYPYEYFAVIKISIEYLGVRLSAGLGNPNLLGFYCVLVLGVAIGLLLSEINNMVFWNSPEFDDNEQLPEIINGELTRLLIILFCSFLLLLMLSWSGSKNAFILFVLIIISFTIYSKSKFLAIATSTILISISISLYELGWLTLAFRRIIPTMLWSRLSNMSISTENKRIEFYQCTIDLIREKPWMGWAIGNMPQECERRLGTQTYGVNHAHNIFLQLASEIGIPFTLVLSGVIGYIVFVSIRKLVNYSSEYKGEKYIIFGFLVAAISGIIMSCFALAILHSYRLISLFCICLAIPYAAATKRRLSPTKD